MAKKVVGKIKLQIEAGKANPMVMGCYGIGVTRVVAAAIEKYHDDSKNCYNKIFWY